MTRCWTKQRALSSSGFLCRWHGDITESADVSDQRVYNHFSDKADLAREALERHHQRVIAAITHRIAHVQGSDARLMAVFDWHGRGSKPPTSGAAYSTARSRITISSIRLCRRWPSDKRSNTRSDRGRTPQRSAVVPTSASTRHGDRDATGRRDRLCIRLSRFGESAARMACRTSSGRPRSSNGGLTRRDRYNRRPHLSSQAGTSPHRRIEF